MACLKHKHQPQCGVTEVHHTLSGGRRRGHEFVVSLGAWHHRAVTLPNWTAEQMADWFGPSLALGSRPFHEAFGTDSELLAQVNKLLEGQI